MNYLNLSRWYSKSPCYVGNGRGLGGGLDRWSRWVFGMTVWVVHLRVGVTGRCESFELLRSFKFFLKFFNFFKFFQIYWIFLQDDVGGDVVVRSDNGSGRLVWRVGVTGWAMLCLLFFDIFSNLLNFCNILKFLKIFQYKFGGWEFSFLEFVAYFEFLNYLNFWCLATLLNISFFFLVFWIHWGDGSQRRFGTTVSRDWGDRLWKWIEPLNLFNICEYFWYFYIFSYFVQSSFISFENQESFQ